MTEGSVEYFVSSYLNDLSDAWTEIATNSLRTAQQAALRSLVAAGLVERRSELRLYAFGIPGSLQATIEFTGEPGFWKAVESVAWSAKLEFPAWEEAVDDAIAQGSRAAEHRLRVEFGDGDHYRLTLEGMRARDDQHAGSTFPTEFTMMIQVSPDKRVEGEGRVLRVEVIKASNSGEKAPIAAEIVNSELMAAHFVEAFKAAFGGINMVGAQSTPVQPETAAATQGWMSEGSPNPDSDKWFGPLSATKSKLAGWIGIDERTLDDRVERGVYAGRKEKRTQWSLWFRDQRTFANYNQTRRDDEQKSNAKATETNRRTAANRK